jgi:hypothetical protein
MFIYHLLINSELAQTSRNDGSNEALNSCKTENRKALKRKTIKVYEENSSNWR